MQPIAIDFETHLISNEQPAPRPVCLSWATPYDSGLIAGMQDMENELRRLLTGDYLIIAHNTTFELTVIHKHFPKLRELLWAKLDSNQIYCSKLYEKLLNNLRRKQTHNHSLGKLVFEYFDEDIMNDKNDPDAWRTRYSELEGVPTEEWPEAAIQYAIDDSIWAMKLYAEQGRQSLLSYSLSVKAEFALNLMAQKGILVDQKRVQQLEDELMGHLVPNYTWLTERGFCRYDEKAKKYKKNYKKFREYVEENIENVNYTAKKAVSVAGQDLQAYYEETKDEVIQKFLDIAVYEKILTAFLVNLKKADPVIRTQYNAIVSSGRTSSSKSSFYPSVNIQQMPRQVPGVRWDVRNCYVPRPGMQIVSIDYSGLELASTANQLKKLFGRSEMCDKVNSSDVPVDMHSMFAHRLKSLAEKRNVTYEEFVSHKKEEGYKNFRQLAKPINLGFPGGIGYDTMRGLLARDGIKTKFKVIMKSESEREIDSAVWKFKPDYPQLRKTRISKKEYALVMDELVELKSKFFALYPDLERFLKTSHKRFLTGDTMRMKNEFGEWEDEPAYAFDVYGVKRDWCTYTALCNGYLMQTPAAVGAKKMMYNIIKKYEEDDRMNPLAFIHDEIVFEVVDTPEKYAIIEDVSEIMIDSMQTVLSTVRIAVEADLMPYWMKAGGEWSKVYWKNVGDKKLWKG